MRGGSWRILVLLLGIVNLDAPPQNAFTLAIVRRDGMMFPFAAYDGKHFSNPWPPPEKTVTAPITVRDIPKDWWLHHEPMNDWTFFPLNAEGGSQRVIHVTGTAWFPAYCLQAIGLRTDYKPTVLPPPPRIQPYPKDGVAVAGDTTISPIEIVKDPNDKTAVALRTRLTEVVNPKEDAIIKQYLHQSWLHPYTAQEREETPITLEALYRVPHDVGGKDVYYFEAVKRYFWPKKLQEKCDLVTFASGWFTTGEGDTTVGKLTPDVKVTSCDFENVGFMLPLGTVTIDRKRLWITQWSNWNAEVYTIMEPREEDVVKLFETPGGECEKR
jgi:hypothetical protein